ncbi:hypothetical protein [Belnapia rosea]|uniref:hypothetical protein n=1 Tax=Belnapia rosea TaxID=938405 RepID=UPI000889A939|nr:hypothetical protein [Belnapia rosea]SDB73841.1 hypothetical protein SAMN02927895_04907 [Belnapia rosea]
MSLSPDQMPPAKPKISPEEHRHRAADRLRTIRLRMAIGRELDERGISTPAEIGVALGMPPAEATGLLNRKQWREGDVARLEAAAAHLGVRAPEPANSDWPS